jgi:hypothetical protein
MSSCFSQLVVRYLDLQDKLRSASLKEEGITLQAAIAHFPARSLPAPLLMLNANVTKGRT